MPHGRRSLLLLALVVAMFPAVAGAATFGRKPYAQNVTGSSVVLRWRQTTGTATITFGPKGGAMKMQSVASGTDQEVTLSGLTVSTRYAYTVDAGGGNTEAGEFTTAVTASEPFTFIAYGDNRTNDAEHKTVVDAMVKEGVDFVVNTGDVVDYPTPQSYDAFFSIEAPLLSQTVLFSTLGNHEYAIGLGTTMWTQQFANPTASSGTERYYTFDFGNSRCIVLDFNSMTSAQTTWLGKVLAEAKTMGMAHIFVFLHHSPYDSGNHGENTTAQSAWVPLFTQYGVDLIVGGHDHDYERGYNATTNLRYVITGGGGAPLYSANSMKSYQQKFTSVHHYVKISVNGPMVSVTALKPDGTVIDAFTFGGVTPVIDMAMGGPVDGGVVAQPDLAGVDLAGADLTTAPQPQPDLTMTTTPDPQAVGGCGCAVGGAATNAGEGGPLALLSMAILAMLAWRKHGQRRRG